MEGSENIDIPPLLELELVHHRQRSSWDCGISCVLMALPLAKREHFISNFNEVCKEEGFKKSTWTIDLCYLLKHYEVSHVFYTITLGIDPSYREERFYEKIVDKDEERIKKRFEDAAQQGLTVHKSTLNINEFMTHLAKNGPIILLINANLLYCHNCGRKKAARELLSCLPWAHEYQGHYIILCGYNLAGNKFYYRNPSYRNRICSISSESLDEARLSHGTDEDAILVFSSDGNEEKIFSTQ